MIEPTLPRLPERKLQTHKGECGRVLLIGGSRGMSGAIGLAGSAALYGGAGLVRLAVPDCCLETVASYHPCYTTVPLPNDPQGRLANSALSRIEGLLDWANVVAIGPGLGHSLSMPSLVASLFQLVDKPLVIDADALNAMAEFGLKNLGVPAGPRVWTPHPGEMDRLSGVSSHDRDGQITKATQLCKTHSTVIVLKGHQTMVISADQSYRNGTGCPAMATGGSGDVLTGLIAALIGQGLSAFEASQLGVYAHGLAAELALKDLVGPSVLPTELLEYLRIALNSNR